MSQAIVKDGSITRKPGAFEKRIHEIDFVRGFLIMLVLMDHLFCHLWQYNLGWASTATHNVDFYLAIGHAFEWYWYSTARVVVRFFALFGFCFVSGISSAFSRSNWIRAGQMLALFGLIAVGSRILDAFLAPKIGIDTMIIDFNIIGVLAWSTLFYCFSMKSWRTIIIGFLVSFLLCWYFIPWLSNLMLSYNEAHYSWQAIYCPPIIEPDNQADWLPLFPFMCVFFMGAAISTFVYVPTKKSLIKHRGEWERPFCFMGRHSLIVYAGHQAVLIPIFLLLGLFLGK